MYGIKQAAALAYNHLKSCLAPYVYTPVLGSVGIWKHKNRPAKFYLYVNNFGITYFSKNDAEHLLNAIGIKYKYTTD